MDAETRQIQRLRAKAASQYAAYERTQKEYYAAVAAMVESVGATEAARRMGVHRQRVYQLMEKAKRP